MEQDLLDSDEEWRTEGLYHQLHAFHRSYYEMFTYANEHWQAPDQRGTTTGGNSTSWRSVSDKWDVMDWYRWKMDETLMIKAEITLRKHILFMIYADTERMMIRRAESYSAGCSEHMAEP